MRDLLVVAGIFLVFVGAFAIALKLVGGCPRERTKTPMDMTNPF